MVITAFEVVSALCTLVAIVCASQVLITGIVTLAIPHFLWFTETQLPTFAGIIAGFVTIPAMLRLKTSKSSPHIDRVFGYTVCYQRLAVIVCIALHFSAAIIALVSTFDTRCMNKKMMKLMHKYHCTPYAKELVDNIQFALQCCGARKYRDWYKLDWGHLNYDSDEGERSKRFYELLKRDTDQYPDLSTVRTDHVPYSCCSRKSMQPCVHQSLVHFGASTINKSGCGRKLLHVIFMILYTEFMISLFCLLTEILIIMLLRPVNDDFQCKKCQATFTEKRYLKGCMKSYSNFTNSSEAEILPTVHSEITISSGKYTSTSYPNSSSSRK